MTITNPLGIILGTTMRFITLNILYKFQLNKHKIKDQISDELIKIFNNIKQFLMVLYCA